jgi:hypothetical protein
MRSSAFLRSSRCGVIVPRLLANRPDAQLATAASARRRAAQRPTSAMEPAGQDLGAPLAPEINGSLARDRFDSDCVLGTQFESSQPHHAFRRSKRFPGRPVITALLADLLMLASSLPGWQRCSPEQFHAAWVSGCPTRTLCPTNTFGENDVPYCTARLCLARKNLIIRRHRGAKRAFRDILARAKARVLPVAATAHSVTHRRLRVRF